MSHSKGELQLQIKLRVLISYPKVGHRSWVAYADPIKFQRSEKDDCEGKEQGDATSLLRRWMPAMSQGHR